MRIGVVSDPHGCLVGLRAALDWLDGEGVDRVVCAGDVASFGPQPNECIALLAEREVLTAQGNCDWDLLQPPAADRPADARAAQLAAIDVWCREQLSDASWEWLAGLAPMLLVYRGLAVVHGGLEDPEEIVDSDARPALPPGIAAVAAGHLHRPFVIRTRRGLWVNAGSAGRPCDGDPRPALALLEHGPTGWKATIHRVAFDLEAAVEAIRAADMPHAERLIETRRMAGWW